MAESIVKVLARLDTRDCLNAFHESAPPSLEPIPVCTPTTLSRNSRDSSSIITLTARTDLTIHVRKVYRALAGSVNSTDQQNTNLSFLKQLESYLSWRDDTEVYLSADINTDILNNPREDNETFHVLLEGRLKIDAECLRITIDSSLDLQNCLSNFIPDELVPEPLPIIPISVDTELDIPELLRQECADDLNELRGTVQTFSKFSVTETIDLRKFVVDMLETQHPEPVQQYLRSLDRYLEQSGKGFMELKGNLYIHTYIDRICKHVEGTCLPIIINLVTHLNLKTRAASIDVAVTGNINLPHWLAASIDKPPHSLPTFPITLTPIVQSLKTDMKNNYSLTICLLWYIRKFYENCSVACVVDRAYESHRDYLRQVVDVLSARSDTTVDVLLQDSERIESLPFYSSFKVMTQIDFRKLTFAHAPQLLVKGKVDLCGLLDDFQEEPPSEFPQIMVTYKHELDISTFKDDLKSISYLKKSGIFYDTMKRIEPIFVDNDEVNLVSELVNFRESVTETSDSEKSFQFFEQLLAYVCGKDDFNVRVSAVVDLDDHAVEVMNHDVLDTVIVRIEAMIDLYKIQSTKSAAQAITITTQGQVDIGKCLHKFVHNLPPPLFPAFPLSVTLKLDLREKIQNLFMYYESGGSPLDFTANSDLLSYVQTVLEDIVTGGPSSDILDMDKALQYLLQLNDYLCGCNDTTINVVGKLEKHHVYMLHDHYQATNEPAFMRIDSEIDIWNHVVRLFVKHVSIPSYVKTEMEKQSLSLEEFQSYVGVVPEVTLRSATIKIMARNLLHEGLGFKDINELNWLEMALDGLDRANKIRRLDCISVRATVDDDDLTDIIPNQAKSEPGETVEISTQSNTEPIAPEVEESEAGTLNDAQPAPIEENANEEPNMTKVNSTSLYCAGNQYRESRPQDRSLVYRELFQPLLKKKTDLVELFLRKGKRRIITYEHMLGQIIFNMASITLEEAVELSELYTLEEELSNKRRNLEALFARDCNFVREFLKFQFQDSGTSYLIDRHFKLEWIKIISDKLASCSHVRIDETIKHTVQEMYGIFSRLRKWDEDNETYGRIFMEQIQMYRILDTCVQHIRNLAIDYTTRDRLCREIQRKGLIHLGHPEEFDILRSFVAVNYPHSHVQDTFYALECLCRSTVTGNPLYCHFTVLQEICFMINKLPDDTDTERQSWLHYLTHHMEMVMDKWDEYVVAYDHTPRTTIYQLSFLLDDELLPDECLEHLFQGNLWDEEIIKSKEMFRKLYNLFVSKRLYSEFPREIQVVLNDAKEKNYKVGYCPFLKKVPKLEDLVTPWWMNQTHISLNNLAACDEQPTVTDHKLCGNHSTPPPNTRLNSNAEMTPLLESAPGMTSLMSSPPGETSLLSSAPGMTSLVSNDSDMPSPRSESVSSTYIGWKARTPKMNPKIYIGSIPNVELTVDCTSPNIQQSKHPDIDLGRKYHGRIYEYDALFDRMTFMNTMIMVTEKINVNERGGMEGAGRDVFGITGAGSPSGSKWVMKIQRDLIDHEWARCVAIFRLHHIVKYYVHIFKLAQEECQMTVHYPELYLLDTAIVVLFKDSKSGQVVEFGSVEKQLPDVKFRKFFSNTFRVNAKMEREYPNIFNLLSAFSHFTYDRSKGKLLATDLQGVLHVFAGRLRIVLTDPAVHTTMQQLSYPKIGNRGAEGIRDFFKFQHACCNEFCKALQLNQPDFAD